MAEADNQEIEVSDETGASRFEIRADGQLAGFAEYRLDGDVIAFTHTEVDPGFGGRGLGTKLIEFAVTGARARGLTIVPRCPFVRRWIEANPERP